MMKNKHIVLLGMVCIVLILFKTGFSWAPSDTLKDLKKILKNHCSLTTFKTNAYLDFQSSFLQLVCDHERIIILEPNNMLWHVEIKNKDEALMYVKYFNSIDISLYMISDVYIFVELFKNTKGIMKYNTYEPICQNNESEIGYINSFYFLNADIFGRICKPVISYSNIRNVYTITRCGVKEKHIYGSYGDLFLIRETVGDHGFYKRKVLKFIGNLYEMCTK